MNKKNLLITVVVVVVVVALAVFIGYRQSPTPTPDTVPTTSALHETLNPNSDTPSVTANSYTLAQVATHSNKSSCWTAINGSVYDVTSWISQHPGGSDAILSLCGTDGSAAFNDQHGGQRRPATELASFKIGVLAPTS